MDLEQKISKHIGWLNHNAGLGQPITAREVIYPLCQIGHAEAVKILKDVEAKASTIKNPTSWVLAAAGRHGGTASVPAFNMLGQLDATGKIAKQVGWQNKQIEDRTKKISYSDVVGPLSMIDIVSAMKILKDLGENIATVRDPTSYVIAAANRRAGPAQRRPWDIPQGAMMSFAPTGEEGKKLSRHIGYMNAHSGFNEPISYSEVKAALEMIGHRAAFKILKDLGDNAANVNSPTGYIIAAAKRFLGADTGSKRKAERKPNERSAITLCWDFVQGHCPRGETCKFEHNVASQTVGCGVQAVQVWASSVGLVLAPEALTELASIPDADAKALIEEIATGGRSKKGVQDQAGYVAKACRRIRADAYAVAAGLAVEKRAA